MYRTIRTGLRGKKQSEILHSIQGQMSDGIWENSPNYERYWRAFEIQELDDGELAILVSKAPYLNVWMGSCLNPYYSKTDDQVKQFFANKVKQIVKEEIKDNGNSFKWSPTGTTELAYLGYRETITVADAYAVYNALRGR